MHRYEVNKKLNIRARVGCATNKTELGNYQKRKREYCIKTLVLFLLRRNGEQPPEYEALIYRGGRRYRCAYNFILKKKVRNMKKELEARVRNCFRALVNEESVGDRTRARKRAK